MGIVSLLILIILGVLLLEGGMGILSALISFIGENILLVFIVLILIIVFL